MSRLFGVIEKAVGRLPVAIDPMSGGCVAEVYKIRFSDHDCMAAKIDSAQPDRLACEAMMLTYLAQRSNLPVPEVVFCADGLLLMKFIEGESSFSTASQQHAAELLAALHDIGAERFGFAEDTLIGGLHQPNTQTTSWLEFFRDQRLLYMGRQAVTTGHMPAALLARLEKFTAHLDRWLQEPVQPSLLHGDVWTTNVLAKDSRISGFIDPAIYYGHPEIELAFTTLFGTFGAAFFRHYNEIRPIAAGFMEERRDIYNLYPLLVHVRLFGGTYLGQVDKILSKLGY